MAGALRLKESILRDEVKKVSRLGPVQLSLFLKNSVIL